MGSKEDVLNRLTSFAIKTSIGFIPIIGPVLSSGIGEVEQYYSDNAFKNQTLEIIERLKKDKDNLIGLRNESINPILNDSLLENLKFDEWLKKYNYLCKDFNIAERMLAFCWRVKQETFAVSTYSEDDKLKIIGALYEFICECESEVWVEDELRAELYFVISAFLKECKEYRAAAYYSIKCIDEIKSPELRIGYFIVGYFQIWSLQMADVVNSARSKDAQLKVVDNILMVLKNTIDQLNEAKSNGDTKSTINKINSTFINAGALSYGQSIDLQLCAVYSYLVDWLSNIPDLIDELFDASISYCDVFDGLNEKDSEFANKGMFKDKYEYCSQFYVAEG